MPQSMRHCHWHHRLRVKCYSHSGLTSKSLLPRWNISPDTGSTHQISVSDLCSTAYSPVCKESVTCHRRATCINTDTPQSIPQRLVKIFDYVYICPLIQHIEKKHKILKYNLPNLIHRPSPERSSVQTESPLRGSSGIILVWNFCSCPVSILYPAHYHVLRASRTLFWDTCIQLPLVLTFSHSSGRKSPPNVSQLTCAF